MDKANKMTNEKVKFLLNWNHFSEHLSSCMTKLMTDSSYSDVIIATADKHMIYSHRFVLANSSKYFQRVLRHINRPKGIQLVVALPEIKYEIFKILMNYMYKGETQVPHELLPSVIKAGQFLEINGLVNLNENEGNGNNESSTKLSSSQEHYPKCSNVHSCTHANENSKGRLSSTLRDKIHSRENSNTSSQSSFHLEKRSRRGNVDDHPILEPPIPAEKGKENRSKLTKSSKSKNISREKKDFIQLPLKRKSSIKEPITKNSPISSPSSSFSPESSQPKKLQTRCALQQEICNLKVKDEDESGRNSLREDENQEIQELDDKITIKMEAPDDFEEVVYNELQCEFCQEVYSNPSDWVRHMTDQHGDRGYQAYKDLDKSVGNSAVITCVVCSCVCFSAAEWAKHLQMWHTDKELAAANMSDTKKNCNKLKKKTNKDT